MTYILSGSPKFAKRRCFISYHHDDQSEVDDFVKTFDHAWNLLDARGLGQEMTDDIINSTNSDYVMVRIRDLFLRGSSVTLVMLGRCTWARRYVDWEIQASLRQDRGIVPNGLLGIKLPSFALGQGRFPERLDMNLISPAQQAAGKTECYARTIDYPQNLAILTTAIEAAFQRRTSHAGLIVNPRDRFSYNKRCFTWI